ERSASGHAFGSGKGPTSDGCPAALTGQTRRELTRRYCFPDRGRHVGQRLIRQYERFGQPTWLLFLQRQSQKPRSRSRALVERSQSKVQSRVAGILRLLSLSWRDGSRAREFADRRVVTTVLHDGGGIGDTRRSSLAEIGNA